MTHAKLHHYVPQFYLRRFAGSEGKLSVWDKPNDRTFLASPKAIAAESDFYRLHEFEEVGHDPLTMEKQLSQLEADFALITGRWLNQIHQGSPNDKIPIPRVHRQIVSRYITVQFLRTPDRKDFINTMYKDDHPDEIVSEKDKRALHTYLLWHKPTLRKIEKHLVRAIWVFGRNLTETPFWTSDNPVAFKTGNNRMWVKVGFVSKGTYAVFPLSPKTVLYCYERRYWRRLSGLDCRISPVVFTNEMVQHENAGQVFMATRFVVSPTNNFQFAREFAPTIGTDLYATGEWDEELLDPRPLLSK